MSKIKHTTAPWHVGSPDKFIVRGPNGYPVCDVTFSDDFPGISEANSRLISAAPELLEALQGMVDIWITTCTTNGWDPAHLSQYQSALSAIAKVTGSQI
ncbi:hypothetical protein [Paraburkholderia antibiotica]|uniref:Uncharacterized protein n=1 Tax=Paraburkholderia antibiotica TaxID=2728839 RepID=A0A7Y0A1Q4_9BURK|nr:hypothetical protein [Paraburkholderia antibiotica]NML34898.1 hypothetical protein [Paraburkholderia antibiotica]